MLAAMETRAFWDEVGRAADEWSIARHPLVSAVRDGTATREQLRRLAVEHWHMTVKDAGPYMAQAYLCMLEIDADGAQRVANNFAEEALGLHTRTAGHDELLVEFWERGLGLPHKELEASSPSPASRAANAYFWFIASRRTRYVGALGIGEGGFSQACEQMLAGLKAHYGLPDSALRFFSGHVEADREHAETGRELIARLLKGDAEQHEFLAHARCMGELYWRGWDSMLSNAQAQAVGRT
jgi:pyrroloquinoline quinone (PQQ) biosynthesis protein C